MADLNNDGKIDYDEYAKYLSSLSLGDLATSIRDRQTELMQERVKASPDDFPPRECTKAIGILAKELKGETNFSGYPVEDLLCLTDFVAENTTFDYKRMFGTIDKVTKKYKITILSSMKAAILW